MQIVRGGDATQIDAALASGEYLWIDLLDPLPGDMAVVQDRLKLHPLAVEDSQEFEQLPKLDHYGHHHLLVYFGADVTPDGHLRLIETHLFVSADWVVTVRRAPCLSLEHLREAPVGPGDDRWIVYRVIDSLTDSFFPVLHQLEERVEQLEDDVLQGDDRNTRQEIVTLRHPVLKLGRVLTAQRDVFGRTAVELTRLPGLGSEATAYFADIQDHLRRLTVRSDTARERLIGAVHLADSVTNNRLALASERFALIATIFLPLTAVSSFFGMNFTWMTDRITTLPWFLVAGVGLPALILTALILVIRRRGFLG